MNEYFVDNTTEGGEEIVYVTKDLNWAGAKKEAAKDFALADE